MISENKKIVINDQLINFYGFSTEKDTSEPILIFLHGWQSSAEAWNKTAEYYAQNGYNCITIDLPGFGKSQKLDRDFTIDDYSKILEDFINKLGLDDLVLIGHSFGGAVSIKLASKKPSFLKKMVLVDSSGVRLKSEKKTISLLGAKVLKPIFSPSFMQPLKKKVYKAIGNEDYLDSGDLKGTYLNVIGDDLTPCMHLIDTPTLIIWGEDDKDTPVWMAETIHKEIKDSKIMLLPNAAHYSFIDQPDLFRRNLTEFLK